VDFDDLLKQGLSQVMMGADTALLMTYHLGGGSDSDRKAGARWLEPMFGSLDSAQVVVCPGAQAAIAALILALTKPGDVILTEPASYPGLRTAATQFGRRIVAVEADQHGMVPEMLEQACHQHQPGLVYLNPTLQNPTAITIPERRRKELASIAKRCNVRIVEDDPYWLLADAPPPPIATFAPEQVSYISTLSKCLTPGLRVAFVLIRDPHERERFLVALRSFALMVAPLTAALATQWILDGSAAALMEGVRKEARLRHWMARDILAGRYSGTGDGLHVWLELPGYWNSSQLARAADSEGIAVTPAEAFATAPPAAAPSMPFASRWAASRTVDACRRAFKGCLICLHEGPSRSALRWFKYPGKTAHHSGAPSMRSHPGRSTIDCSGFFAEGSYGRDIWSF
jgi:DNA-binding transcriptional MocR family regulator